MFVSSIGDEIAPVSDGKSSEENQLHVCILKDASSSVAMAIQELTTTGKMGVSGRGRNISG